MKKVLITGINGFLGSHLAKRLKNDFEIIGLEVDKKNLFRLSKESFIVYSINDDDINKIFFNNDFYAVIHAATVYSKIESDVLPLINSNLLLPVKLYQLSCLNNVKLFINTDSFFNDSNFTKYKYQQEYTLSKKQVIEWLKIIQGSTNIINMKIFHMYGNYDNPQKFIPKIVEKLKSNEPEIDLTPGEQKRDFIYIDDVLDAYWIVLKNSNKITDKFVNFDLGYGKTVKLKNFVKELKRTLKSKSKLNFGALQYRENEIMYSRSNNRKLKDLGWQPRYNYIQGIKKLIELDENAKQ